MIRAHGGHASVRSTAWESTVHHHHTVRNLNHMEATCQRWRLGSGRQTNVPRVLKLSSSLPKAQRRKARGVRRRLSSFALLSQGSAVCRVGWLADSPHKQRRDGRQPANHTGRHHERDAPRRTRDGTAVQVDAVNHVPRAIVSAERRRGNRSW